MLEFIGKKIGMSHLYEENGSSIPLTFIQIYDNVVFEFDNTTEQYSKLVLAFEKNTNIKKISKSVAGKFIKKGLPIFNKIHNSRVKKTSEFKVGESLDFVNFLAKGDKITVTGITVGKGFAGSMKRWGFRGLEASHGVSISHRSHGSTGQRQDPGKVFKGKKMAGHMGVKKVSTKNLEVIHIDKEKSLIAVSGCVPGSSGKDVILRLKD